MKFPARRWRELVCAAAGTVLLATLAAAVLVLPSPGAAATAPYPYSRLITAMSWDLSTVPALRKAHGSDLWPLAWAADGNLYGGWGDGGGFDGDSNYVGRVSLGFARISGTPVAGQPASYSGKNVWGDAPQYAQNRATFGGKIDDLISVNGVLYAQGGFWTAANCGCSDPTLKPGANMKQQTVAWSADLGRSWHIARWTSSSTAGASLQYGRDYEGALDPEHVYFYYQRDTNTEAQHIYLRRALIQNLAADPAIPGVFEYLSGIDEQGRVSWSTSETSAVPVFSDPAVPPRTYANASVVYDAALRRYLLTAFHGDSAGQIGFFEAPAPWGPWATIAYYDDWGGLNESAGEANGLTFPAKWLSQDGKTLWGVFSAVSNGYDSFNVAKAELTVGGPDRTEVGYWAFNEGRGDIAADDSGNGNLGTLLNAVAWAPGESGEAVSFDGERSAVVMRGSGSLANLYRHGLTVTAWIKPRSGGNSGRIVDKDGNATGWFLKLNGTSLQFAADQFSGAPVIREAALPVTLNAWQQVAVTWDGSTRGSNVHLYLNGEVTDGSFVDGEGTAGDDSAVPLTVGNRTSDLARGFDGLIDEVHIYDRVLSAEEIRAR